MGKIYTDFHRFYCQKILMATRVSFRSKFNVAMEAMARLLLCLPDKNSHIPLQTVRLPEGVSQYLQFYLREFCISQVTL